MIIGNEPKQILEEVKAPVEPTLAPLTLEVKKVKVFLICGKHATIDKEAFAGVLGDSHHLRRSSHEWPGISV